LNTKTATRQPDGFASERARCLARNLKVLHRVQPEAAAMVASASLPTFEPTVGRDGSATFLLRDCEGGQAWFGGSSMPEVSSRAMFGGFVSDGSSLALPSVLTGMDLLVLLDRLPAHAAVFVMETSPAMVNLAMRLYDYAAPIEAGRLVWLIGSDRSAAVVNFFASHVGYELPCHVPRVPQCPPQELALLQRELEGAAVEVGAALAQAVRRASAALGGLSFSPITNTPCVAVVGVDPRAATINRAHGVGRALTALGWRWGACIPDAPDKCHSLARLDLMERLRPEVVLFMGGCPEPFRAILPEGLAVVSWCAISGHEDANMAARLRPRDLWCAETVADRGRWIERGMPEGQVCVLDVGVDEDGYRLAPRTGGNLADVAMWIDPPDDRPGSCGVTLASHVALWRSMQHVLDRACDNYTYETADAFFRQAETESQVRITDAAVRARFLGMLRNVIAPARVAFAIASRLGTLGVKVDVFGANWPRNALTQGCRPKGPMPIEPARSSKVASYRLVVLGHCVGPSVELAMQTLSSGVAVACRGTGADVLAANPDRTALVQRIRFYRTRDELEDIVHAVIASNEVDREKANALRSGIVASDSYQARLRRIHERLRAVAQAEARSSGGA